MNLQQGKCTSCNASIHVDLAQQAAICPYCGNAYVVQQAMQSSTVNTTNHTNNVTNVYHYNSSPQAQQTVHVQTMHVPVAPPRPFYLVSIILMLTIILWPIGLICLLVSIGRQGAWSRYQREMRRFNKINASHKPFRQL